MKDSMKTAILAEAKKMFREQGYSKMRMVELANRLGISRGNLTYHYNSKDVLVEAIWDEYESKIYQWVDDAEIPFFNRMSRAVYEQMIFDINIFTDPEIERFYLEQIESPGFIAYARKHAKTQLSALITSGYIRFNTREINYITEALIGSQRAMDTQFILDKAECDVLQYAYMKQKIRINMFSVVSENALRDLESARNVLNEQDFSSIRAL